MSPAPACLAVLPGPAADPLRPPADAMAAVLDGLGSLARVRAAELPAAGQADLLRALEQAESMLTAARSAVLHAFSAGGGHEDDGQHSARSWLVWQARVTRGAAAGAMGWMKRLAAHPAVDQAMAAGEISASWAKRVCELSDRMPEDHRDTADDILLAAASSADVTLADLHGLAEEMFRRCAPPDGDGTGGPAARGLYLETHFRGAGKLDGDLTPRCAEALGAVLESLGKRCGAEDQRTKPERMHDALEEALRRLIAAGGLPDRAGQPTQIQLHMTLEELLRLQGATPAGPPRGLPPPGGEPPHDERGPGDTASSDLRARGRGLAGGPSVTTLSWLAGPAAGPGALCDAAIVPVVTGRVDPFLLDALAARFPGRSPGGLLRDATVAGHPPGGPGAADPQHPPDLPPPSASPDPPDPLRAARDLVLAEAIRLLSGPGGLAAVLRTGLPVPLAATASLPLDLGKVTDTIPPHLRRAVIARDRTCRFPGCDQPPAACQVHHVTWRSHGGKTSLHNLVLMCAFHHQHVIHEQGWGITLRPDATLTATSPDGSRVLHSHSPPVTAAA